MIISYRTEPARAAMARELGDWMLACGLTFHRVYERFLPKQNAERQAPQLVSGPADEPPHAVATENGFQFGIEFTGGYSAGLFLDQRENRQFVRRAAPRHLLNCFAYTCSFSVVAAALGGRTTSVDLSKKSLSRGKDNFKLNKLDANGHRFIDDDVLEVLPKYARKGEKFDLVILDPPTFSRSHEGRLFQVEQDFENLLTAALEVTHPSGKILLSTNCAKLDELALEKIARFSLKIARRSGTFQRTPPLPDFLRGGGARTVWLCLK